MKIKAGQTIRGLTTLLWMGIIIFAFSINTDKAYAGVNMTRLHYSVRDDFSRLIFYFDRPVTYSAKQQGDRVYIYMNETNARAVGFSPFNFNTGLVGMTRLEPVSDRSVKAEILLRDNSWYQAIHDSKTSRLFVYVYPSTMSPGREGSASFSLMETESIAPVVQVTEQNDQIQQPIEERHDEAAVTEESEIQPLRSASQKIKTADGYGPLILTFSIIISAFIFAVAGGLIYIYLRMKRDKNGDKIPVKSTISKTEADDETDSESIDDNAVHQMTETGEETEDEASDTVGESESDEYNESDNLAEKYSRGKGEMDLVLKLKTGSKNESIVKKIGKAQKSKSSRTALASTAKKLGIGQGEIKLARNLKKMNVGKVKKKKMEAFHD